MIDIQRFSFLGPRINGPLKCFSCGKLGYDECKEFDPSNPELAKVCAEDEVCMIYAWDKTQNQKGIDLIIRGISNEPFHIAFCFVL